MSSREDQFYGDSLTSFFTTHDIELVKNYFTNTVLTPSEVGNIIANANLKAA